MFKKYAFNFIRTAGTVALLGICLINTASAERPRMVISEVNTPGQLDSRERSLLAEINFAQQFREALVDARSFSVLTRDNRSVGAMLDEQKTQEVLAGEEGGSYQVALDKPDFFALLDIRKFSIHTRYTPVALIDDLFERRDTFDMEFAVTIIDARGNNKFEEAVSVQRSFGPVDVSQSDKKRNALRYRKQAINSASSLVEHIVSALNTRINPIEVLAIQGDVLIIDRGKNNGFDLDSRMQVFGKPIQVNSKGETREIPGRRLGEAKVLAIYEDRAELQLTTGSLDQVEAGALVSVMEEVSDAE